MPYRYLEDVSTADAAFEAWGGRVEEMFVSAADAMMGVMVEDLEQISARQEKHLCLMDETVEMLLYNFLQMFLYFKDKDGLLLRVADLEVVIKERTCELQAVLKGEKADAEKHSLGVDVKALTLHQYEVQQSGEGWKARVVVDI